MIRQLQNVGQALQKIRKQRGYTSQETFANAQNMARVQYRAYEQGQNLTLSTLLRVLEGLKIRPEDFFWMVRQESSTPPQHGR
jgi:transcriptional regulator with XRE-family HTH domain